ncbi:hypothetical protein [Streptomyces sp. NPDC006309]|uniref:hypothetical protein n=1 Tax=Streptomyces sp. NPDC006309 TaxID=3156749 RepID=UPI0033BC9579
MTVAPRSPAALPVVLAVARPARRAAPPERRAPLTGETALGLVLVASVTTVVPGPLPALAVRYPAAGAPPRPASRELFRDGV